MYLWLAGFIAGVGIGIPIAILLVGLYRHHRMYRVWFNEIGAQMQEDHDFNRNHYLD